MIIVPGMLMVAVIYERYRISIRNKGNGDPRLLFRITDCIEKICAVLEHVILKSIASIHFYGKDLGIRGDIPGEIRLQWTDGANLYDDRQFPRAYPAIGAGGERSERNEAEKNEKQLPHATSNRNYLRLVRWDLKLTNHSNLQISISQIRNESAKSRFGLSHPLPLMQIFQQRAVERSCGFEQEIIDPFRKQRIFERGKKFVDRFLVTCL